MRFIGGKSLLLEDIENVMSENIENSKDIKTFCDIFSGTSVVGRYFKEKYKILSNDMLYFSYVLQKATICNNEKPKFRVLKDMGIEDPIYYLENADVYSTGLDDSVFFIYRYYSPNKDCERMYLSNDNARRIDFIRLTIERWHNEKLITDNEYYYLLMCLIEGVPSVSNTTGTYGAYLKHWDNRSFNKLKLVEVDITDNNCTNECFNEDSNELIKRISGDILYIDPPYNKRQYVPNYHLLETIAKYDNPEIYGKTGLRPYDHKKSKYCMIRKVENSFDDLISHANFKHIIMSYSTEGIMSVEDIEKILKKHGKSETFKMYNIAYRKYKSKHKQSKNDLNELIFYIEKKVDHEKELY